MKHNLKWLFAFALTFILTFACGQTLQVSAEAVNTTITFDKEYSGSTEANKVDKYNMTLPTSGRVTIIIESTGWHSWELLDSDYEKIDGKGKTGGARWTYDLTAGTYQLSISQDYNHNLCDYTVSVHFDSANETYTYENNMYIDVASCASIPFNKKITGQLAVNDTIDYFKLEVPADGKVHFSVITNASEVKLTVNDSNNKVLETLYFREAGNQASYTLKKGTYYLCFSNVYNSTGVYNYTVSYEMDAPTNITAKASSYKALKVTAKKTGSITGYQIRYKAGSKSWKTIKVAGDKNLSKTLTGLTPNTYRVQVRTYCTVSKNTYYSPWSETQKVTCKLSTPTSIKLKSKASGALTLTAKKKETITGYTIRYKTGSGSWKQTTVKGNKNLNKTIKKLKKNATYKVQVRSYITISKKNYYSSWSSTRTIKTKK